MTVDELIAAAAQATGIDPDEIRGRGARRDVSAARKQVYAILRRSGWSYPQIGRVLGRDHSTVQTGASTATWEPWMDGLHVEPPARRARPPRRRICKVTSCRRSAVSRGWCAMHYQRWLNHGTTDEPPPKMGLVNDRCERCGEESLAQGRWCLSCFQAFCDARKARHRQISIVGGLMSTRRRWGSEAA